MPAGIYTTSSPEQARYIANHCQAAIAVVGNPRYLETIRTLRPQLPHLRHLVLMAGEDPAGEAIAWRELLALGARAPAEPLAARLAAQGPDDLCTLIYTSGTTGEPKAVMLCHRNLTFIGERVAQGARHRAR